MKRGAALVLFGVLATAQAQDIPAYSTLARELDAAAQGAGGDKLATLNHLDAAQKALETLTPTLGRAAASDLQNHLTDIRAAQSRTPADLQAQVLLARGVMRRNLYDQTVGELGSGNTEQLQLLARELKVADTPALLAAAKAGQTDKVVWRLQKSAATQLSAALGGVDTTRNTASYLNLARASGWFTVLQGSEAAQAAQDKLNTEQFDQAMQQLVGGQSAALGSSLQNLRAGAKTLNAALAGATVSGGGKSGGSSGAANIPSVPAQPAVKPKPAAAPQPASATTKPASKPPVTKPVVQAGAVAAAYTTLGRALGAAAHSDMPRARQQIDQTLQILYKSPEALQRAPRYPGLIRQLRALSTRKALSSADVQAAIAELGNVERQAAGQPVSALDSLSVGVSSSLGGGVRILLGLLLAVACAAPLYLLSLAFGNTSRSWRAIRLGLLLVLMPLLVGGIAGLVGWLGDLLGAGPLRALHNLVPGQNLALWPLWWLLTAVGIGFLGFGFWGLCVQFGLLGKQERHAGPRPAIIGQDDVRQTSVDWDEDV